MSLFAFEHVTKGYPDGRRLRTVLEDVSFEVDADDFVGLWGMRRSGKSTLLRLAAGFELPDEGRILFDGQDLTELSGDDRAELLRARGIGFVTSDWRPSISHTTIEYVAVSLLADSLSLAQARREARRQLEHVGALSCAHMLTDRLSLGESLRASLAECKIGVTVTILPHAGLAVYSKARTSDGKLAAIAVVAHKAGNLQIIVLRPKGARTIIAVHVNPQPAYDNGSPTEET
jgi:predicted ABC-type transport system involved in lysophospholipase L1 biosynthesis ATPase subunit